MKITTEFANFGCEFCLVSRPNNSLFPRTIWIGRYQKDKPFSKAVKQTVKVYNRPLYLIAEKSDM